MKPSAGESGVGQQENSTSLCILYIKCIMGRWYLFIWLT